MPKMMIDIEEARAYALEHFPSPVVRRHIEALLEGCPRAEVESVRHGKWIDNTKIIHGLPDYIFNCSECDYPFYGMRPVGLYYCPDCGSKMDQE